MKKVLMIGLVLSFLLLAACDEQAAPSSGVAAGSASSTVAAETRTVTDQNGDEITLPQEIQRVVITSPWPLPSVYCLYMGSGARIVGIHPAVKSAAQYSMLMRVAPELAEASSSFIQGDEVNIEELMKLKPDVAFYPAGNAAQKEAFAKAGIPAVAFSTSIAQFNTIETVNKWVELLGQIFGDEVKAKDIVAYGRQVEAMIADRLKAVSQEDKPRALILYQYKAGNMQTSGSKFFGQYWCDATGAINVAESEAKQGVPINMEQVYEWNPDVIFVTNFSPYLVDDFLNNVIPGDDWSGVKAVIDQKVFKYPLGMYRWYPPSSDSPLSLIWMAKQNHPELFADIDMDQEIKDYYKRFYDVALDDADVEQIMNPPREAADGV